ncbi:MAG TPA: amidohydrolase family protein [Xanthobacteraceae bacterium]|nr:amidohydrolase family protein [Xanthobacteraceae bacterium]
MTEAPTLEPAARGYLGLAPIDCDIHVTVPDTRVLLPYFDEFWREQITQRGIERHSLNLTSYPPNAPLSARPDFREKGKKAGSDLAAVQRQALDPFGTRYAICNVLHAAQVFHSDDMSAVFCTAVNEWLAKEWLDKDARLRGSILVPTENPDLAVEEIERRAGDNRFVQVLMFAMNEKPLGRRSYWPIYRAAEKHKLPIGIHAGSLYRHAPSSIGWGSYYLEDYVLQSSAFESTVLSMVTEGVFAKFPELKVVLMESGFMWLPPFLWRANKTWRGVRAEVPWVKQPPGDIIRDHVRLTVQPIDAPPEDKMLADVLQQIGSDKMLLFSTDYPHWHFDGNDALPAPMRGELAKKIMVDNPLETFARLR